jgi:hypothetical protein
MKDLRTRLRAGMVMVSPAGGVGIIRTRTSRDDGWNRSDGAALSDEDADDPDRWTAYTPEDLVSRLHLARLLS